MGARDGPRIRSQLVGLVLAHLRGRGVDDEALARRLGLPPTARTNPEVVLPLERLRAFFDAAVAASGDPDLGLSVALSATRGRWPVVEYGGQSAPTLRDALAWMTRYIRISQDRVVFTFEESKTEGTVTQSLPGHPLCLGKLGNEFFAVSTLHRARVASGRELLPTRVFFAHAAPADRSRLHAFFGRVPIAFHGEQNGFALARADLDVPLPTRDPALMELVGDTARRALEEQAPSGATLGERARRKIREQLHAGEPAIDDVAGALGMSGRTLQRRLADEQLTHQALLQSVREELAKAYLADPARPLAEVAFLLSYAELPPFVRAFRRWTGSTPAAYRRAIVGGAGATPSAGITERKRT